MNVKGQGGVMDRTGKVLKTVFQLKDDIEALLKESQRLGKPVNPQKAMVHLTQLNSIHVTWDMLKETKIGFSVNDLRKASSNGNVKVRAKRLIKKWKELETSVLPQHTAMITGITCVDRGNGAMREAGFTTTTIRTRTNLVVTENVSSTSVGNHDENDDRARWTVRFAPDGGVGLKLIFAKRKPVQNQNLGITKNSTILSS